MGKNKFGIFSPILGEKLDFPTILLDKTIQVDNSNILRKYGEVHRRKMREPDMLDTEGVKYQTPDTCPILHFHRFVKRSNATEYILAFTEQHIYHWNTEEKKWDKKYTCSTCTEWDTVTYNDKVIATNNVDCVLYWSTSGDFAPLGSASGIEYATGLYLTKAKYVITFENYLQLGYTYENGVSHPQRIRWSDIGDETLWKTGDAGSAETEGFDFIRGFKIYAGQLIIFKEKSRIKQWLISTSEVWNWVKLPGDIGLLSNHSIVEDANGRVYFLASDFTIREMEAGEISHDIDPVVKLIKPSSDYLVQGVYIEETGEIWWSIPYDNDLNNKVITYKGGSWGELDLAISCFGDRKEAGTGNGNGNGGIG